MTAGSSEHDREPDAGRGTSDPCELSVVIPTFNGAATIGAQLEALAAQQPGVPWEVVVADNGSTDGTPELVHSYSVRLPELRVVDASALRGPAYARNRGAAAARGRCLVFCDDDDVVAAGWLAAMAEALGRHRFVAGWLDVEHLNPPWAVEARGRPPRGLSHSNPRFLPHAATANLGIDRRLFEQAGGFDVALRKLQDTDLCWRVQLLGEPLRFVDAACVHYRYRERFREIFSQARDYGRGSVVLYKRYRSRGMDVRPLSAGLAGWAGLLVRAFAIRDRAGVAGWVWRTGWKLGRLEGSLRCRVLAL